MNKIPAFALFSLLIFTLTPSGFTVPQAESAQVETYDQLLRAIRAAHAASQARVDYEKVWLAWETGKLIDGNRKQETGNRNRQK